MEKSKPAQGPSSFWRQVGVATVALGLLLLVSLLPISMAAAQEPTPAAPAPGALTPEALTPEALTPSAPVPTEEGTSAFCLSCHGNPDLNMTLPSGETLSLYVSPDDVAHSVHGQFGIECRACHTNIHTYPHPPIEAANAREFSRAMYGACQGCHANQYEETQDSIHADVAEAGNLEAPICTDCHGAHNIQPPAEPRTRILETCGQCHKEIADTYAHSVHGESLVQNDNPDVPTCVDCHGVHDIHDPRTEDFRVQEPELCAGCHSDAEMMGRYDIQSDVYDVYHTSWHGVDVSVYQARWPNLWHRSAVCSDCHGVHDILRTENPGSRVHVNNLLATCQQCHPGAGPNWTSAWTGHYQTSLQRNPAVYYTELFYNYFAYGTLWISALYVFLQIIRATVARVRRSL